MSDTWTGGVPYVQRGMMPPSLLRTNAPRPTPAVTAPDTDDDRDDEDLTVGDLTKQYESYVYNKTDEIREKRTARHYYNGDQWTSDELKKLKARGQPKVTKNRIKKKINGIVGLIERLRQDPKAYPRTKRAEVQAELATMCIRYVLDNNRWESLSSKCAGDGGREGLGGLELGLRQTPKGDLDITLTRVATDTFFYDARSVDPDFLDCTFMGTSKWCDVEIAKQLVDDPDIREQLEALPGESGGDIMDEDSDRTVRWMSKDQKRIRLVDHWYLKDGEWRWCLYTRGLELMRGISPFVDEDDKTICKFIMYSAYVDHDGDRYGFIRDMKDTQDEINHRYSKALHLLNTRRMTARRGSVDVEKARQEAVKADGVVEWDIEKPEYDDAKSLADMQGQMAFLEDNKKEIEMFGPNPQLLGNSEQQSGRAIALLQQAGISELGPYIIDYKDWKLRVYRAVFNACKKHWTKQRWIVVTDPQGDAQVIAINEISTDQWGMPQIINSIAELDVHIIIDEGADTINMMQDAFDTLSTLASRGAEVPPGLLIELAPIQTTIKKKWLEKLEAQEKPDPLVGKAKALELEQKDADIAKTKSEAIKNAIAALKDAPLAFHPAMPQLDQRTLSLADQLDDPIAPPAAPSDGAIGMPPGAMPGPAEPGPGFPGAQGPPVSAGRLAGGPPMQVVPPGPTPGTPPGIGGGMPPGAEPPIPGGM